MNPALGLMLMLFATAGYAVVNSVEIAIVAVNRIRVRHLAEGGSRAAQALERLHHKQEDFFAAVVLLQNVCVVGAATIASLVAAEEFGGLGVAFSVVLVPAFTTQFGELIPKVLAARAGEHFALTVALPAEALTRVLAPLVWAMSLLSGLVTRIVFGTRLQAGPSVTEAELRMLIDMSAETGSMAESEAELLDRVFHFGDRRVHEVMVPRTEMIWLPREAGLAEFFAAYSETPHSRFPVCEGGADRVIGILGIKDVLTGLAREQVDRNSPVEALMRQPLFVPESKLAGDLFREMQASGTQMAIAVDEFGGTAGLVTLEQLLEEMVGNVHDELGLAAPEFLAIDEHTIMVDGTLSVEEARQELGIEIPEGDYDTIAGFVLESLGHIPREGEQITLDGVRILVAVMKGPRIESLRVVRG